MLFRRISVSINPSLETCRALLTTVEDVTNLTFHQGISTVRHCLAHKATITL